MIISFNTYVLYMYKENRNFKAMILTKEQTYRLIINNQKANSRRFKTSTKIRWKCLNCQKDIYVSEKAYSVSTIFCNECKPLFFGKETIAQYQYLKILKDYQLKQLYLVFGKPTFIE